MKILVIGGGGREHAICPRSASTSPSPRCYCAPGNPGIAEVAELRAVDALDPAAVARLAAELGVDLVVVGPEAPLVAGVADAVREAGIAVLRAVKGGRAARGVQSLLEGGHGRGRGADRRGLRVYDA